MFLTRLYLSEIESCLWYLFHLDEYALLPNVILKVKTELEIKMYELTFFNLMKILRLNF